EIMDEIENMTQGWWRPSPGSVYPMLEEMVKDGLVKKGEDGKYERTAKTRNEDERPFGSHFDGPRSADDTLNETSDDVPYFDDTSKTDKSKLESYSDKIRTITDRLSALIK